MHEIRRLIFLLAATCACATGTTEAAEPAYSGPESAGRLEAPPRREASGLAASRRSPGVWWLHDDSGGAPVLHAVDASGKKIGALRIADVKNHDWEDLAAFTRDGKAWLLIADTGDNEAERNTVQFHLLEEPARETLSVARERPVAPAWTLRVRYEDGAHDCEAVAVDPVEGAIYLLTKRDAIPRLYRVPLAASDKPVIAQLAGTVSRIAAGGTTDDMLKAIVGKKMDWPTAMDFAADGSAAVVLTYGDVLLFTRQPGESWAVALARAPQHLGYHLLPQAEGVAFSSDGREIRVVSETSTEFVRYTRPGK